MYFRHPRGLSSQTDYAKAYQEEEAANLMHYSQPQVYTNTSSLGHEDSPRI